MPAFKPIVLGPTGSMEQLPVGSVLAGANSSGSATLDFGLAPGSNIAEAVVTGLPAITAGARVQAWLMASSTASHNSYEHAVVPMKITCGSVIPGTGFTITGVTEWRLTGTFTVQWIVWA